MKPKIALAKYLDWVVLAILAAALIVAAVKSFVLKASAEEKLREELTQADQAVRKGMDSTSAKSEPLPDYLGNLRGRLEHPAVIGAYRHNPFLTREDIPYPPLQLRVGVPRTLRFTGTRFTRVIAGDEKLMSVEISYDLLTGVSTVTFTPLDAGETSIRIQTDEDLVYLFKISARTVVAPPPPNSPIDLAIVPRATIEIHKTLLPAMVLLSFSPDDPREPSRTVGFSNNAAIYRKPANASDAEYVRVDNPDEPLVPLNREQIHAIMQQFQIPELSAAGPAPATAPAPAVTSGPAPAAPPVPEAVTEIRPPAPAAAAAAAANEPPAGSFVFLDQTVDDGETYIYKIVTLSTAPDVEPVPCQIPYVSDKVFVPSFVEFVVRSIGLDSIGVRITRRDPDTLEVLAPQDFTVGIGKLIGGMRPIKIPSKRQIPGTPTRFEEKNVDFSTGCILVNVLPEFRNIEYKLRWGPNFTAIYQAKETRDPQILYLTPRGALRFKGKEITLAAPALDNRGLRGLKGAGPTNMSSGDFK
jgi:hypothetical protein